MNRATNTVDNEAQERMLRCRIAETMIDQLQDGDTRSWRVVWLVGCLSRFRDVCGAWSSAAFKSSKRRGRPFGHEPLGQAQYNKRSPKTSLLRSK